MFEYGMYEASFLSEVGTVFQRDGPDTENNYMFYIQ